ncbi:hypothetical protein [Mesorhizobium sp.]|uniref:hypothetical protein n=1 Tax=Mesorhizobium sp. TaxID=1871066 RepID=UPI000FE7C03B|nr:hypothetical protein [Mesorhizobium sp.]RWE54696.1 MAG: hypothetical protein EOS67_23420 [Mesorhizobium sp.]
MPKGTIVGVTKAKLDGKAVQTCTVAMTDVDHETFLKSFFSRTDAEKIDEKTRWVTDIQALHTDRRGTRAIRQFEVPGFAVSGRIDGGEFHR